MMELSGTQAAALVLGHDAELCSHAFSTVYVSAALKFVRNALKPSDDTDFSALSDSDSDDDAELHAQRA